jgi:hypothetical protein
MPFDSGNSKTERSSNLSYEKKTVAKADLS